MRSIPSLPSRGLLTILTRHSLTKHLPSSDFTTLLFPKSSCFTSSPTCATRSSPTTAVITTTTTTVITTTTTTTTTTTSLSLPSRFPASEMEEERSSKNWDTGFNTPLNYWEMLPAGSEGTTTAHQFPILDVDFDLPEEPLCGPLQHRHCLDGTDENTIGFVEHHLQFYRVVQYLAQNNHTSASNLAPTAQPADPTTTQLSEYICWVLGYDKDVPGFTLPALPVTIFVDDDDDDSKAYSVSRIPPTQLFSGLIFPTECRLTCSNRAYDTTNEKSLVPLLLILIPFAITTANPALFTWLTDPVPDPHRRTWAERLEQATAAIESLAPRITDEAIMADIFLLICFDEFEPIDSTIIFHLLITQSQRHRDAVTAYIAAHHNETARAAATIAQQQRRQDSEGHPPQDLLWVIFMRQCYGSLLFFGILRTISEHCVTLSWDTHLKFVVPEVDTKEKVLERLILDLCRHDDAEAVAWFIDLMGGPERVFMLQPELNREEDGGNDNNGADSNQNPSSSLATVMERVFSHHSVRIFALLVDDLGYPPQALFGFNKKDSEDHINRALRGLLDSHNPTDRSRRFARRLFDLVDPRTGRRPFEDVFILNTDRGLPGGSFQQALREGSAALPVLLEVLSRRRSNPNKGDNDDGRLIVYPDWDNMAHMLRFQTNPFLSIISYLSLLPGFLSSQRKNNNNNNNQNDVTVATHSTDWSVQQADGGCPKAIPFPQVRMQDRQQLALLNSLTQNLPSQPNKAILPLSLLPLHFRTRDQAECLDALWSLDGVFFPLNFDAPVVISFCEDGGEPVGLSYTWSLPIFAVHLDIAQAEPKECNCLRSGDTTLLEVIISHFIDALNRPLVNPHQSSPPAGSDFRIQLCVD